MPENFHGVPATLKKAFRAVSRLFAWPLLGLITIYQLTLSPVLPVLCGPGCGCRFAPSCSQYAAEALRLHGFFVGSFLALRRLLKCHPLHPGGPDPVPERRARPGCRRIGPARAGV